MNTREYAHELIDSLPEPQISGLIGFLETIIDPVAAALRKAPIDDEPFTDDERNAVAEADQGRRHGATVPLDTVLADFGLTLVDWETMGRTPLPEEGRNGGNGARHG
jgi:hypothetical protein